MKKLLTSIAMALLLVGCASEYDDSALQTRVADLERRVNDLEINVAALQTAVGDGIFVKKVQEYRDPDTQKIVGITVTFTNDEVKWFQIEPVQDYAGPVLGVIKSGTGELVWAVDGQAIEVNGEEVPVYQTPVFSIDEEGNLWVEVDGEKSMLGPVKSEGATLQDGIFTNIEVTDEAVILTLSDETTVSIPFAEAFQLIIDETQILYKEKKAISIPYTVAAKTASTVVGVAGYSPMDFKVEVGEAAIEVTPMHEEAFGQLIVYADSKVGLTSMVTLSIEPEGVFILDKPAMEGVIDYIVEGDGGTVEVNVLSNVEFDVVPAEDWIKVVSVKADLHVITLSIAANDSSEEREGLLYLNRKGTDEPLQTVVIGQWPKLDGPKNLAKYGSANSYIITAPGEYMFPAVKGNSTQSVGEVASVEVLWATANNDVAPNITDMIVGCGFTEGNILVDITAPLTPGNAVIAAKDASDKILWSWHIWIPATEITTSTFGGLFGDAAIMDRNLGALVVTGTEGAPDATSYGMYYQWGRKDPFVAPSTGVAGTMTYDAAKMSVEESVQNPSAYVTTGSDSVKDWNTESATNLWGTAKTIYDPCPPGYIVPTRDKTTKWWGEKLALNLSFASDNTWFKAGVDLDETNPGTTGYAVFPVSGYIDQGSLANEGARVYIWSAYSSSADLAYMTYANKGAISVEEQRKSRAGNIRCVVEVTE